MKKLVLQTAQLIYIKNVINFLPLQYKGYYKALVKLRFLFDSKQRLHETLLINVNFQKLSLIASEMSAHEYIKSTNQLFKRCIDSKILQGVFQDFIQEKSFLYIGVSPSGLRPMTLTHVFFVGSNPTAPAMLIMVF